jgi:hypothetical protein
MNAAFFHRLVLVLLVSASMGAAAQVSAEQQQALKVSLESYSSCSAGCAAEVAKAVGNEGVDTFLGFVGAIAVKSTDKNKKLRIATWFVFMRSVYESGKKVVSTHAVCANACDAMHSDIVTLGSAGVLGPLLKKGRVDEQLLNNPKVFETYQKYVKPVPPEQLPWQFHNQSWWKKVASTA